MIFASPTVKVPSYTSVIVDTLSRDLVKVFYDTEDVKMKTQRLRENYFYAFV